MYVKLDSLRTHGVYTPVYGEDQTEHGSYTADTRPCVFAQDDTRPFYTPVCLHLAFDVYLHTRPCIWESQGVYRACVLKTSITFLSFWCPLLTEEYI